MEVTNKLKQTCKKVLDQLKGYQTGYVSVDLAAGILFLWASVTLFGFWENPSWVVPDEIWRIIAIAVLIGCIGKIHFFKEGDA